MPYNYRTEYTYVVHTLASGINSTGYLWGFVSQSNEILSLRVFNIMVCLYFPP
jgi:hypothetical protein